RGKPVAANWTIRTQEGEKSIRANLRSKRGRKQFRDHLASTREPTTVLYQKANTLERLDTLTDGRRAQLESDIFSKHETSSDPGTIAAKPPKPTYRQTAIRRAIHRANRIGLDLVDGIGPRELLTALLSFSSSPPTAREREYRTALAWCKSAQPASLPRFL